MKTMIAALFIAAAAPSPARAAEAQSAKAEPAKASARLVAKSGMLGLGAEFGEQNGGTVKYWLDGVSALDAGLGASWPDRLSFHAGYLWHGMRAPIASGKGELALHLGAGFRVREDGEFGLRGVVGADYWPPDDPFELFAEVGPIFRLTQGAGLNYTAVAGLRWYFKVQQR